MSKHPPELVARVSFVISMKTWGNSNDDLAIAALDAAAEWARGPEPYRVVAAHFGWDIRTGRTSVGTLLDATDARKWCKRLNAAYAAGAASRVNPPTPPAASEPRDRSA